MPCKIEDAVMLGEIYDDIKITSYFKNEIEWNPAKTDLEGATETMKNSIPGKISYKFDLQFDGGKVEYDNFHTQGQDLFLTLHRFTPEAEQVITQLGINLQGANK